jgi:hypothetical protein
MYAPAFFKLLFLLLFFSGHGAHSDYVQQESLFQDAPIPWCSALVLYHRIQKSGSTCILDALYRSLQQECGKWQAEAQYVTFELRRNDQGQLYDTDVMADAMAAYRLSLHLLHGHFYYGIHIRLPLGNRPLLMIVSMVDPMQRIISHYNFRKRMGLLEKQLAVSQRRDVTWQRFIDHPTVLMCNEVVAALAGDDRLHQRCDHYQHEDYELLRLAKRHLDSYDMLFLREYMQASWQMMQKLLPTFPQEVSCSHDNANRQSKELPTKPQFRVLEKAFLLDRMLYDHAVYRFEQQAKRLHVPCPPRKLNSYYSLYLS